MWKKAKPPSEVNEGRWCVEKQRYLSLTARDGSIQKHLRCTIEGPASSYSSLLIHICWKVDRDASIEPPIQTEYLRSGGAII